MDDFTNELIFKLNSISWQLKRIADVMERDQKIQPTTNHPTGPKSVLNGSGPNQKFQHMMDQLKRRPL